KADHSKRYIQYAANILKSYRGDVPFNIFLKKYFSLNKKHGSRDRRILSALCYGYFRLGHGAIADISIEKKLLLGYFLTQHSSSPKVKILPEDWNDQIQIPVFEKLNKVKDIFDTEKIFPLTAMLSKEICKKSFQLSFLFQPDVFLRVRPGFYTNVINTLKKAAIPFEIKEENCLALTAETKISEVFIPDKMTVIQDYNSQKVGSLLITAQKYLPGNINCWDCCAGSGGKSILAYDILKNLKLTVSDKRKSILDNLQKRFSVAGIKDYKFLVADIAAKKYIPPHKDFDLIIADVPCSGSGTWSRTPEQLRFFHDSEIDRYATLQKNILRNTVDSLKPGGCLVYVTCSVFEKENEANIHFVKEQLGLELLESHYFKGYEMKADTLFGALFLKK
ncbi:MAG: Fmu (Sun) domain-containing protein, partial [Ginsengibacter sp.]